MKETFMKYLLFLNIFKIDLIITYNKYIKLKK